MKIRALKYNIILGILVTITSFSSFSLSNKDNHYYYNSKDYYKSCWQWLDLNNDGVYECYYFNVLGHMYKNGTTPDGYQVNANGEWVVDGIVQCKTSIEVKDLIDINIATVSSTYNTKNYVIADVKKISMKN